MDEVLFVFQRDDYSCQECGTDVSIVIHHRDCNRDNNCVDNLVVLCRSCHCKLHGIGKDRSMFSTGRGVFRDVDDSGRVYLPKSWIGKRVSVVLLED